MAKTTADTGNFIHFEGTTFNPAQIIAISGPSVELNNEGKVVSPAPFFTVHLAYGVNWRITAKDEKELTEKREKLVKLLA